MMLSYDSFNSGRPEIGKRLAKAAWALIGIGVVAIVGVEYCSGGCMSRALGSQATACEYTIENGDTLTELLALEGKSGTELEEEVNTHCMMNRDRMMPDTNYPTTVFDISSGYPDCDRMRAGGRITVFDYNEDGFIGGQECAPRDR